MNTQQLNNLMNELNSMLELAKQAQDEAEAIKDQLKEYMTAEGLDELIDTEHGYKATFRETISNRFDSTSFKKVHAELYKAFTTKTAYKRFTFK